MCEKRTLYKAGEDRSVGLRARGKGGKLNFDQICYATDCVREVARRMDMPMAKVIGSLRENNSFQSIYKEARKRIKKSAKVLASELVAF